MKKNKIPNYFTKEVDKIFPGSELHLTHKNNLTIDEVNSEFINFDNLKKLSDLFKTTKINTGMFVRSNGCPTCGYDNEVVVSIDVLNPDLTPRD